MRLDDFNVSSIKTAIVMQINLILTTSLLHLASLQKKEFLELGNAYILPIFKSIKFILAV